MGLRVKESEKIGLIFIAIISFGGKVFDSYMAIMLGL